MKADEELRNLLWDMSNRLDAIEGTVTAIARSNPKPIVDGYEKVVRADPIIGHIYLQLNGERTQKQITEAVAATGVQTSPQAVGRWLKKMTRELWMAVPVDAPGGGLVWAQPSEAERVFHLSRHVRKWLGVKESP